MSNRSIEDIYNKALKLLEGRFHSTYELKRKLEMKGYDKNSINTVLEKLKDQDYLNDERFAEEFLGNLIKYKTFGYYGLQAKLMKRGIEKQLIADLLKTKLSIGTEKQLAAKVILKSRKKDYEKLARSLASKGFRTEVIRSVLEVHVSELADPIVDRGMGLEE